MSNVNTAKKSSINNQVKSKKQLTISAANLVLDHIMVGNSLKENLRENVSSAEMQYHHEKNIAKFTFEILDQRSIIHKQSKTSKRPKVS
jgi:hypothetical protein